MDQTMGSGFPINTTHAPPTSHGITTTHQIVASQNPPPSCRPQEKRDSSRCFDPPDSSPREFNVNLFNKSMVERLNKKFIFKRCLNAQWKVLVMMCQCKVIRTNRYKLEYYSAHQLCDNNKNQTIKTAVANNSSFKYLLQSKFIISTK